MDNPKFVDMNESVKNLRHDIEQQRNSSVNFRTVWFVIHLQAVDKVVRMFRVFDN
jgi:hypothetical protein